MSELKIKGQITKILNPESGVSKSGKEWNKQDFVITTDDQYPKDVCFTLFGDKTSLLSDLSVGMDVNVHFNLESREYNGKYFHNVNAWRIEKLGQSNGVSNQANEIGSDLPPEFDESEPPF